MKSIVWNDEDLRGGSEKGEKRLGQCPCGSLSHVDQFLSSGPLTEQEVLSCLAFSVQTPAKYLSHLPSDYDEANLFCGRMRQLKHLKQLVPLGQARVDFDDRLVPLEDSDHRSADANHDNGQHLPNHNIDRAIAGPLDDRNDEHNLLLGPILENFNDADDDNNIQAREEFLRLQHQDAAKAVHRLLTTRYEDTPKHSLQLIAITTDSAPVRPRGRLTFRRICCAVTAVVTAFVCIMIRSLPSDDLIQRRSDAVLYKIQKRKGMEARLNETSVDKEDAIVVAMDALLHRIAKVRLPTVHIRQCGSLQNRVSRYLNFLPFLRDCSDGVLQVPAVPLNMLQSSNNVTWHFSCPGNIASSRCFSSKTPDKTCPQQGTPPSCFRGIHDGLITDEQVANAISLGKSSQSDHFDIHYDVHRLPGNIVDSLYGLLTSVYRMPVSIKPVAFRVYATAPRNGDTTYFTETGEVSLHPLSRLLNRKYFLQWVGDHHPRSKPHLESINDWLATAVLSRWMDLSQYFRRRADSRRHDRQQNAPIDHCRIFSDVEVNEQFQVHSSIFLNDDFSGGAMLFVDHDGYLWNKLWPSRDTLSHKIRRGIAVYGRTGRVVVSSGDNQRCGLPVRKGIRAVLQIWWKCT